MPDVMLTVGFSNTQAFSAAAGLANPIKRGMTGATGAIRETEFALGRITGKATEFQKSLDASTARVVAFGASAGAIHAMGSAFQNLLRSVVEVEEALTEINVLLRVGSKDLAEFSNNLFRVANLTGQSFSNAAKAAQEFARQGLSMTETLQRTQSALTLTRLSGLALEESVAALTATMNSFTKEALRDIDIVNRLANVDAKFAVSSADLAEALKRVSGSAADAGVEFNDMIALITAAQQSTARGGAVIGNSFKTIFTRLQRPQVLEDLETAGVAVRDLQGDTFSMITVLKNLADSYDGLCSSQKSFVAETVGGVYQINILKAILNDLGDGFGVFDRAAEAAANSSAAAEIRLQELNNTIATKLIQTFNNLTQVASGVGNSVFEPTIRGSLEAINSILKVKETLNESLGGEANKGIGTDLFEAIGKGLSNVLSGPGIQFAVFGLIKLFQKLQDFVINSVKDLTGVNNASKERAAIENTVVKYLSQEKELLKALLDGNVSINQVHDQILSKIIKEAELLRNMATLTKPIADALQGSGVRIGAAPTASGKKAFVPNLALPIGADRNLLNAAKDAISRENSVTGGNAVLAQSPKLVTPNNPLGLVAIDKRNQSSADEAIQQHLTLGESLSDINRPRRTKYHVPNLAVDVSSQIMTSAILAAVQNFTDIGSVGTKVGELKRSFGAVATVFDKESREIAKDIESKRAGIAAQRDWVNAFEKARAQLLINPKQPVDVPVAPGGKIGTFNNSEQLVNVLGARIARAGDAIKDFDEQVSTQRSRIRRAGFTTAIGGGLLAGPVGQAATAISPDLGAASDQFFQGLQTSGQILTVFQGAVGKAAAGFFLFNGVVNAADSIANGLESSRQALDKQLSSSQKLIANVSAVSQSLHNLDSMAIDSTVSLEALNREQRKFQEALTAISVSGPSGKDIASRIQAAPTTKEKLLELERAKREETLSVDKSAALFQFKELGAERGLFGIRGSAAISGGIFAGGNTSDRLKGLSVIKSGANTLNSLLTNEDRKVLESFVSSPDKFKQALESGPISRDFTESIRESGGTERDVRLFTEQMRLLINTQASSQNEDVRQVRAFALEENSKRQFDVDAATRATQSQRRLFLNSGLLAGTNLLDQQKLTARATFNEASIAEATARALSSSLSLLSGEQTVAANELQINTDKTEADRAFKISNIQNQASRGLLESLSQNVDELGKRTDVGSKDTAIPSVAAFRETLLRGLNKGLESTVRGGDLTRFVGESGQLDFDSLKSSILSSSGLQGQNLQRLDTLLNTNKGSLDIMKLIQQTNTEIAEANDEASKELRIHTSKFDALISEVDIKKQIGFLGGTRALTDRGARREIERDFRRGQRLFETGRTSESRARGAAQFLEAFKASGGNLSIARRDSTGKFVGIEGNAVSQQVAKALNTITTGVLNTQQRIAGRVTGSINRVGPDTSSAILFNNLLSQFGGRETASVAVSAQFRPEGDNIIQAALSGAADAGTNIGNAFNEAGDKIKSFTSSLSTIEADLRKAIGNESNMKKVASDFSEALSNMVREVQDKVLAASGGPLDQSEIDKKQSSAFNTKLTALGGLAAVGGAAAYRAFNPEGFKKTVETINNRAKTIFSRALPNFPSEYGFTKEKTVIPPSRRIPWFGIPGANGPIITPPPIPRLMLPAPPDTIGRRIFNMGDASKRISPRRWLTYPSLPTTVYQMPSPSFRQIDFEKARQEELRDNNLRKRMENKGLSKIMSNDIRKTMSFDPRKQPRMPYSSGFAAPVGGIGGGLSMLAPSLISSFTDNPLVGLGAIAATQSLGALTPAVLAGGAGAAFGAGTAVPAALAAGATAYGGFKVGQFGYRAFNKSAFEGVSEGTTEASMNAARLVQRGLRAGKSADELKSLIDAQITSTQGQLATAGGGGFLSSITGLGSEADTLKQAVTELQALKNSIDAQKDAIDAESEQTKNQEKLIAALEKLASGGGTSGTNGPIQIEISVKDIDKLPEQLAKLIRVLEQQLKGLQNRVYNMEKQSGIEPAPASVG